MIKPITITIFKRLRNDDVGGRQQHGNCGGYCKECKNNKAQSINDHSSIFPILCHCWVIVVFSHLSFAGSGNKNKLSDPINKFIIRPIRVLALSLDLSPYVTLVNTFIFYRLNSFAPEELIKVYSSFSYPQCTYLIRNKSYFFQYQCQFIVCRRIKATCMRCYCFGYSPTANCSNATIVIMSRR